MTPLELARRVEGLVGQPVYVREFAPGYVELRARDAEMTGQWLTGWSEKIKEGWSEEEICDLAARLAGPRAAA